MYHIPVTYMPVTRDLSATKKNVIIEWLSGGCLYDCNDTTPTTQFPECQFIGEGNNTTQNEETGDNDVTCKIYRKVGHQMIRIL